MKKEYFFLGIIIMILTVIFSNSIPDFLHKDSKQIEDFEFYVYSGREKNDFEKENGTLLFTGKDILSYEYTEDNGVILQLDKEFIKNRKDYYSSLFQKEPKSGFLSSGSRLLGFSYNNRYAVYYHGELRLVGTFKRSLLSSTLDDFDLMYRDKNYNRKDEIPVGVVYDYNETDKIIIQWK